MTVPSNTVQTYAAKGIREDLIDQIFNIDPWETPFLSRIEEADAEQTLHEWQTDALPAAVTNNAVIEGDDVAADAFTATVRLGNITQLMDAVARVSSTHQATRKAGRSDELAYQIVKQTRWLRTSLEKTLLANQAKAAGDASTARTFGAVLSWLKTNEDKASDGTSLSAATGAGTRGDGTQRALTESMVKTVLQSVWTNGGNPEVILLGAANKVAFSGFTGGATQFNDKSDGQLNARIDYYASDFGTVEVIPNRLMRSRDLLIIEPDMWAVAYLQRLQMRDLAVTGHSEAKMLWLECTLESRNEKASGIVADLS